MDRIGFKNVRLLTAAFAFLAIFFLIPPDRLHGQSCDIAQFASPKTWTGTVTTTIDGSGVLLESPSGDTVEYSIHQSINLSPVVNAPQGGNGSDGYFGTENATVDVRESYIVHFPGISETSTTTIVGNGFVTGFLGSAVLAFEPLNCTYDLSFGGFLITGTITTNGVSSPGPVGTGPLGSVIPLAPAWQVPLPTTGTTLTGSTSFDTSYAGFDGGPYTIHVSTSWSLNAAPDLDVLVMIPAYSTWRPTGGLSEQEIGLDPTTLGVNLLEIQAQLVTKSTGQPTGASPDKWTFSLVQVSHEPGVAMNWPAQEVAREDPDLSFDHQACFTPIGCQVISENNLFTMSNGDPNSPTASGTVAELLPPDPLIYDSVKIMLSPHDWGAWATLNVTATVGSQKILGHLVLPPPLVTDPNDTDILLPQRQAGSFIADNWKDAHNIPVSTIDEDDSEAKPNGDGQSGDGLTLYEEYRGFYMGCRGSGFPPSPEGSGGCQHVEGDPGKKDLFVVDEIPTIANGGVALFKKTSGLSVHYLDMTLDDIHDADPLKPSSYRVINFNHSAAPHEVDQHALIISLGEQSGYNEAVNSVASRPGLPKEIDHIAISSNYEEFGRDLDASVAHELAHSVDVYHHGDVDGVKWWMVDSSGNVTEEDLDNDDNPISSTSRTIYVKYELDDPSIQSTTVKTTALDLGTKGGFIYVGNNICADTGVVVMNGQHSGDEDSYMRYVAAQAYIPSKYPKIRFWITEPPKGLKLTDHPAGTGINLDTRDPRPRYGDAYSGAPNQGAGSSTTQRGNDASQIDINDNHDAIIRPNQVVCP